SADKVHEFPSTSGINDNVPVRNLILMVWSMLLTRDRVVATYYTKLVEEVNEDIMIFVKCLGIVNNIPVIQLCFPAVEGIDLSKLIVCRCRGKRILRF